MRVLMIAPPGAGKGTQGALIAAHFDIPHIATGELLRDHVARRTALGLAVQEYLDRGELVPDQVVLDMVREEVVTAKAAGRGFVLDGIPRNMQQARALYLIGRELGMIADVALHLQADDEELMRRLLARAALEHRSDDTARHHCPAPCRLLCGDIPHRRVVPRPRNPGLRGCDAVRASGRARNPHRPRSDAPVPGPGARAGRGSRLTSPAWGTRSASLSPARPLTGRQCRT